MNYNNLIHPKNYSQRITIDQSLIEQNNCYEKQCILLVGVYTDDNEISSGKKLDNKTFTIELFTHAKTLLPGQITKHYIDDSEYQYFTATLGKNDNSLIISVTKLDNNCNPDLAVNEGITVYPDLDDN